MASVDWFPGVPWIKAVHLPKDEKKETPEKKAEREGFQKSALAAMQKAARLRR